MPPHLSYELARQRITETERAARSGETRRATPVRRSSFVLVRASPAVRVFRRLRPEGAEP